MMRNKNEKLKQENHSLETKKHEFEEKIEKLTLSSEKRSKQHTAQILLLNRINEEQSKELTNANLDTENKIKAEFHEKKLRKEGEFFRKENIFKNKIEQKEILAKYILEVLYDNGEMLDSWPKTAQLQANELRKDDKKLEEIMKI